MEQASNEIERILRRAHNLRTDEKNDFTVQNQTQLLDIVGTITNIFTITISSIAGISLLVGGIGIMNIMLSICYRKDKRNRNKKSGRCKEQRHPFPIPGRKRCIKHNGWDIGYTFCSRGINHTKQVYNTETNNFSISDHTGNYFLNNGWTIFWYLSCNEGGKAKSNCGFEI